MGQLIQKKSAGGRVANGNVSVKKPSTGNKLQGNGKVIQKVKAG
jgi:hypothetical protein